MWTPGRAPSPKGGGGGRNHFHPMDGSAAALPPKLPPHRRRKPKRKRPVGPPRAEGRSGGARRRDSDGDGDSDGRDDDAADPAPPRSSHPIPPGRRGADRGRTSVPPGSGGSSGPDPSLSYPCGEGTDAAGAGGDWTSAATPPPGGRRLLPAAACPPRRLGSLGGERARWRKGAATTEARPPPPLALPPSSEGWGVRGCLPFPPPAPLSFSFAEARAGATAPAPYLATHGTGLHLAHWEAWRTRLPLPPAQAAAPAGDGPGGEAASDRVAVLDWMARAAAYLSVLRGGGGGGGGRLSSCRFGGPCPGRGGGAVYRRAAILMRRSLATGGGRSYVDGDGCRPFRPLLRVGLACLVLASKLEGADPGRGFWAKAMAGIAEGPPGSSFVAVRDIVEVEALVCRWLDFRLQAVPFLPK